MAAERVGVGIRNNQVQCVVNDCALRCQRLIVSDYSRQVIFTVLDSKRNDGCRTTEYRGSRRA